MDYDVIVVGAGAAGLMAAIQAAQGGLRVLILEGQKKVGAKILMSGGTRCNVTNKSINEKFARMESMAIETVKTPTHFSITEDSATVAQRYVYDIENRGIYYWKENLLLLDEVYKLHLLPSQRDAVTLLRKYCNIRLESYKLIVRKLSENTTEYDTQIKQDTKEADEIVETIKNAFSVTPH